MTTTRACADCGHPDEHTTMGCLSEAPSAGYCECPAFVQPTRPKRATPGRPSPANSSVVEAAVAAQRAALPEPPDTLAHDGQTYDAAVDAKPLNRQQQAVFQVMRGPADRGLAGTPSEWLTLAELAERTGFPEASVSARLRDLRKPKWGGHRVDRRRRASTNPTDASQGVLTRQWEYRLVPADA